MTLDFCWLTSVLHLCCWNLLNDRVLFIYSIYLNLERGFFGVVCLFYAVFYYSINYFNLVGEMGSKEIACGVHRICFGSFIFEVLKSLQILFTQLWDWVWTLQESIPLQKALSNKTSFLVSTSVSFTKQKPPNNLPLPFLVLLTMLGTVAQQ